MQRPVLRRAIARAGLAATAMLAAFTGGAGPAAAAGDPARGEAIARHRSQGLCVLCHALPGDNPALQGTIGPPLAGVGARLDAQALRQRLLAPERFNPETVMPAYGRVHGLVQVAAAQRGRPLLSEAEIDDLVAWLVGLK